MFTKNYDNIMLALAGCISQNEYTQQPTALTETNFLDPNTCVGKSKTGVYCGGPTVLYDHSETTPGSIFNCSQITIVLADGYTPATYYDYQLSGTTIAYAGTSTGYTGSLLTLQTGYYARSRYDSQTGKHYTDLHFEFKNNGSSNVNVSEVGFLPRAGVVTSSGSNKTAPYLMYHEILDRTYTIEPGQYFIYEASIELPNYRPNKPTT